MLVQAYPGYPGQIHTTAKTPEQRIHAERRELGIDHALVGGVMARRWGLPQQLAAAIEHHHAEDVTGEAALVRLADMLAHYAQGQAVAPDQLLAVVAVRKEGADEREDDDGDHRAEQGGRDDARIRLDLDATDDGVDDDVDELRDDQLGERGDNQAAVSQRGNALVATGVGHGAAEYRQIEPWSG